MTSAMPASESPGRLVRRAKAVLGPLKQAVMTAAHWTSPVETLRFFRAVRRDPLARQPVTRFRYARLRFGIRPVDWYGMKTILLQREYAFLGRLFADRAPRTVIDAGAHIGLFAVYLLSSWPEAEVFSIEASPETFALLERNREANPSYAWRARQFALWDEDGEVFFDSGGLSLGWHVSRLETGERVAALRLDTLLASHLRAGERVSLLKIDVEGAEERVLAACPEVLDRTDAVVIEVHPGACDQATVVRLLRARFPYLYEVSAPDQRFPVLVAERRPRPGAPFRPLP